MELLTRYRPLVSEGDNHLQFPPGSKMPPHFVHWRAPVQENYIISPEGHPNSLQLKPSKLNLTAIDGNAGGPGGQTFVGRRQVDSLFHFSFDLNYTPKTLDEEAGITLFLTQVKYHNVITEDQIADPRIEPPRSLRHRPPSFGCYFPSHSLHTAFPLPRHILYTCAVVIHHASSRIYAQYDLDAQDSHGK